MRVESFACGLVLAFSLAAQEPARERAFGRVRGADGKPWGGATVHLLHRSYEGVLDGAFADHVVVETDERGRFRTELLAGMPYAVWAHGDVVDGCYRCSNVVQDVVPVVPIVLAEEASYYVRTFQFELPEQDRGELRVEARGRLGRLQLHATLVADEQGTWTTPRWPCEGIGATLFVDGVRHTTRTLSTTVKGARRRGVYGGSPAIDKEQPDEEIAKQLRLLSVLPYKAPDAWPVRIVGVDGKPVAGAEIRAESRPPRRVLGVTDEDGKVVLPTAPYRSVVLAPGHAEGKLGGEEIRSGGGKVALKLVAGRQVTGRVTLGDEGLAGAPIVLQASIGTGPSGSWFGVDPRLFRAAADGTFVIPGRCERFPFRLSLVLNPLQRARLTDPDGAPVWPLAMLYPERKGAPEDIGDVRVDQLRAIDVTVRAQDGTPPGSIRLVMAPMGDIGRSAPHEPDVLRTDRRGRVRVLAADHGRMLVHATTRAGACWAVIEKGQKACDMKIDAAHAVRFRAQTPDGKPLVGAAVGLVAPNQYLGQDPTLWAVVNVIRDWCMVHAVPHKSGRTDENGYVDLVMPSLDSPLDLYVDHREANIEARVQMVIDRERDRAPVVLEVSPKR